MPRSIGARVALRIHSPTARNNGYVLAASLQLGTLPLPVGHVVPLSVDPVFNVSLTPGNGIFNAFRGTLNGNGDDSGQFVVPNLPAVRASHSISLD